MLEPEIAALDHGAVGHLGVFVEPNLVLLRTSRNDHDVARCPWRLPPNDLPAVHMGVVAIATFVPVERDRGGNAG
jgi:hypothetical protein